MYKLLEDLTDELCPFCKYKEVCSGITLGPNGPIYPVCAETDTFDDFIDFESLMEAQK